MVQGFPTILGIDMVTFIVIVLVVLLVIIGVTGIFHAANRQSGRFEDMED